MWQSATAFVGLLAHQQHLLFGGLGEAIAVIVGGVVSVITLRRATRSAAPRPAPTAAPVSRRPAAPPAYGAPAPPTAPARRLHPGPISLSAPTPSPKPEGHAESDDNAPMSSLFNPDIFEHPQSAPPLLRPISAITAEWRAQMAASPSTLAPAPIWNRTPFARPARPEAAAPLALDPLLDAALVIAPPVWRRPGASAPDVESPESLGAELPSPASAAPVWGSWLSAGGANSPADDARAAQLPAQRLDAPGESASDEQHPPIWSSFLRRE
jgi:hypothetical protein